MKQPTGMAWTMQRRFEDIATRRPRLAIALLQLLVQPLHVDFGSASRAFRVDKSPAAWAAALIRFSEAGHQSEDGSVQMIRVHP